MTADCQELYYSLSWMIKGYSKEESRSLVFVVVSFRQWCSASISMVIDQLINHDSCSWIQARFLFLGQSWTRKVRRKTQIRRPEKPEISSSRKKEPVWPWAKRWVYVLHVAAININKILVNVGQGGCGGLRQCYMVCQISSFQRLWASSKPSVTVRHRRHDTKPTTVATIITIILHKARDNGVETSQGAFLRCDFASL